MDSDWIVRAWKSSARLGAQDSAAVQAAAQPVESGVSLAELRERLDIADGSTLKLEAYAVGRREKMGVPPGTLMELVSFSGSDIDFFFFHAMDSDWARKLSAEQVAAKLPEGPSLLNSIREKPAEFGAIMAPHLKRLGVDPVDLTIHLRRPGSVPPPIPVLTAADAAEAAAATIEIRAGIRDEGSVKIIDDAPKQELANVELADEPFVNINTFVGGAEARWRVALLLCRCASHEKDLPPSAILGLEPLAFHRVDVYGPGEEQLFKATTRTYAQPMLDQLGSREGYVAAARKMVAETTGGSAPSSITR